MLSLPKINYSVNTDVVHASAPPLNLGSGDVLNYVQLNLESATPTQAVMIGVRSEGNSGVTTFKVYSECDDTTIETRMTYSELCLLEAMIKAMVKNLGERRGLKSEE